jgi:hypothetical protein
VFISELIPTSFIKEGKAFGITPGMVATVDIRTVKDSTGLFT